MCMCASVRVHVHACASVHLCVCASVRLCVCASVRLCVCASVLPHKAWLRYAASAKSLEIILNLLTQINVCTYTFCCSVHITIFASKI